MAMRVVGQPIVREDGPAKVTGAARYTADVPLRDALWAKCLRSPYPHARIVRVDTSRAARLPGVVVALAGAEFPPGLIGRRLRDQPIVARDRVRFVGERVAAVAANDLDTAEEALSLIDVEYEELPAVLDPLAAMEPDAPLLHPDLLSYEGLHGRPTIPNVHSHILIERGDLGAGFAASDLVLEHTYTTPPQHQGYIEPYTVLVGIDASGRPDVWMSNKGPFLLRGQMAAALDMPEEWLRCNPVHIGGDFGGKGSPMDAPVAYQLARRAGRPIRMVMTYAEELLAGTPRHASVIRLRTGVRRDGTLVTRDALVVWNGGAYGAHKPVPTVHIQGGLEAAGSYRIPNVRIDSRCVYTNQIPAGFMRSPGRPQMAFAVESEMDLIAKELGMDPVELRRRNVIHDGDVTSRGHKYRNVKGEDTLRAAAKAGALDQPRPPLVGRGLAFADRGIGSGETGVTLRLHADGRLDVRYGMPDQGVGVSTMLRQVVAEATGLPVEQIAAAPANTDDAPYDSGIGASRHTHISGRAALQAAEQLAACLAETAAELLSAAPEAVERQDGHYACDGRAVPLAAVVERAARTAGGVLEVRVDVNLPWPDETCFIGEVAEVEVDPETGGVRLRKLTTVHDVGMVINPLMHQGQIDGGIVQGIGQGLIEEMLVEDGRVTTLSLGEYKLPTMADIPALETVLLDAGSGPGPYGAKAIGEMTSFCTPAAIANAVADACGVRLFSLPITAEKVWRALAERAGSQT
ncbi:MAG TPA: xanthine dehydrogenase family protein molybdopterin-binding subunit [Chloroflexota bacterium]